MAVLVYPISTGGDDGYAQVNSGGCTSLVSILEPEFGWKADDKWTNCWWRVPAVALAQGATPEDAFLALHMHGDIVDLPPGVPFRGVFYGIDEDDHAAPTSTATWDADHAAHTDAYVPVTWPFESGTSNFYSWSMWFTPNLAGIVTEVVGRVGWSSENDLGFHFDYDNSHNLGRPETFQFRDSDNTYMEPSFVVIPNGEIWARPIGIMTCYSSYTTAATKHLVAYPPDLRINEVVYCAVCVDGAKTVTWPAGWTELVEAASGTAIGLAIGYHKVDGTETEGSFMLTLSGADSLTALTFRIQDCENPATAAPEVSTAATGTGTSADSGAITPSSSKKWLEMVVVGTDATYVSADPTGFSVWTNSNLGTNERLSLGFRWVETDAEIDPSAWTLAASQEWAAVTVLIPPAATPNCYRATQGGVWGMAG